MKRRLLPLCTALVLCLLLAPAAWAAVYPYPPIETLHIGSHDGTEIQKDTYYLVRGETVTTQGANADNYNIYYKDGTLTLRAAALPDYLLVPGETTIHLVGENTIGTKDSPTDVGIQGVTPGAITITGPGSCSIHSSAEGIITVQPDSATDPQVTSDIRLQGGTINTNGSSISTRYGGICITGSAQVTSGSLSTGGDPNTEEAQRARDLVISGRASVTAERLSALQQIQITGSATVTVENPAGIAINGNRGIAISEQARVTAIGTTGDPEQARTMGRTIGGYLKHYGFNLDLAPVADVNSNPLNPVIGRRAFSSDPDVTAGMVRAAVQGFHEAGMLCTLKHFPGHGDTLEDSHAGTATSTKTW